MSELPGAERRLNLLTNEWVLLSPNRLARPWLGAAGSAEAASTVAHDPDCYLCAGAKRAGGALNPWYEGVYVFNNDFPALRAPRAEVESDRDPLLVHRSESGICRVICYSPDHSRALPQLSTGAITDVVAAWSAQTKELAAMDKIGAVTIFENRGAMMGASNPHPHGQIWATQSVPNVLHTEAAQQRAWLSEHGQPLLMDYLRREVQEETRIVVANDDFVALVPYWASWPFEILVLPREQVSWLVAMAASRHAALADILKRLTSAYDALFRVPFPYSMGLHQTPVAEPDEKAFTFHIHFYPPLLRSATIRKFMVGFEMFAMPQRDLSPEDAAQRLRAVL